MSVLAIVTITGHKILGKFMKLDVKKVDTVPDVLTAEKQDSFTILISSSCQQNVYQMLLSSNTNARNKFTIQ